MPDKSVYFSTKMLAGIPWVVAAKVVLFGLYFAVSVVTVRLLGPTEFGIFSLVESMAEYLVLLCGMELGPVILRYVPDLVSQGNRKGINCLLRRVIGIQLVMVVLVVFGILVSASVLMSYFHTDSMTVIYVLAAVVLMLLLKETVNTTLTSFFAMKSQSILSVCQTALRLGVLLLFLVYIQATATMAILSMVVAIGTVYGVGLLVTYRHVKKVPDVVTEPPLPMKRMMTLSLPMFVNSVLGKLMFQYSELFFLGFFCAPAVVGYYQLGYTFPLMAISLVPLAVRNLFIASVSEAYDKDPDCFYVLLPEMYKFLAIVSIPVAVFGALVSPVAVRLIYGPEMIMAGYLASWFFCLQVLYLVNMPPSIALITVEKVHLFVKYRLFEIAVNLTLDYFLIKYYGLKGAVIAVSLTFFLVTPYIISRVRKHVPNWYIPVGFISKIIFVCLVVVSAVWWVLPYLNLLTLFLCGIAYMVVLVMCLRFFRVIKRDDVIHLFAIDHPKLQLLVRLLTGIKK